MDVEFDNNLMYFQALKKEVEDLRTQLDVLRQQLEDEVVLRTELENKLATYKEDLEFSRRSHSNVRFC